MWYVSLHMQEVYFLSRTLEQPLAHLASCSVDAVDPSSAIKQLMHEADQSPLFSAEVTDERNVLPVYVFMVYTGTTLPFTILL
jgi:hypothetical protein